MGSFFSCIQKTSSLPPNILTDLSLFFLKFCYCADKFLRNRRTSCRSVNKSDSNWALVRLTDRGELRSVPLLFSKVFQVKKMLSDGLLQALYELMFTQNEASCSSSHFGFQGILDKLDRSKAHPIPPVFNPDTNSSTYCIKHFTVQTTWITTTDHAHEHV